LANRNVVSYCHYLHVARFFFSEYSSSRVSESIRGKTTWWLHKRLFPFFFPRHQVSKKWLFVANSMVTFKHTCEVLKLYTGQITLLNPPVTSININRFFRKTNIEKEDLAISIGRFERSKKFDEIIKALALKRLRSRLKIIGFTHDKSFLNELYRRVKDSRLQNNVEIMVNASRKVIIEGLLKAKAIVHLSEYEPFGISVVEGMGAGCIPIVKKGFNGPWMEILEEGKYGLGVQTLNELVNALKSAIEDYESFDINAITSRALKYDQTLFRTKFLNILGGLYAEE